MVENIDTFVKGVSAECISVKDSSVGCVSVGVVPADGRNRLGASAKGTPVKNLSVEDTCVCVVVVVVSREERSIHIFDYVDII